MVLKLQCWHWIDGCVFVWSAHLHLICFDARGVQGCPVRFLSNWRCASNSLVDSCRLISVLSLIDGLPKIVNCEHRFFVAGRQVHCEAMEGDYASNVCVDEKQGARQYANVRRGRCRNFLGSVAHMNVGRVPCDFHPHKEQCPIEFQGEGWAWIW